jgi:glycosyltransferase involved in cell wall biosynthesis
LRILLYANADAAEAGGVQAVVRGLAAALAERGHRVSTGWAQRTGPAAAADPADGWAEAWHLRRSDGGRWLSVAGAVRLMLRLLRERPEVVNIHYASPSALYFQRLARLLGFRTVVTCHGSDVLRPLPQDAPFLGPVIAGADAVTVVSTDIAVRLAEQGIDARDAPRVIANGVDTDFWHTPETRAKAGALPTLVAVGRLEEVKGFDILLEACALLAARGTPARLVLIGEGSQGPVLAAQAERLGIAAHVTFAGRLAPPAIRAQFHAADLFVLPSRSEGMPLALLEAMASGTACVASDVGGVARTAGGAARLVPPEEPQALADAIASLAGDDDARTTLRRDARTRALAFSVSEAHAAYEAVMLGLVRGTRA